jgi:hypothetical protein
MNAFIYDLRTYKYKFIQAYFHFQLVQAERLTNEGKGRPCVIEEDIVASSVQRIRKIIENNNNTYEDVMKTIKFNPLMSEYYNIIGNTVKKHFTIGKGWIPSFLAIEVLRIFDEKGYTTFKEIDFVLLQGYYQKHDDRKENDLILHYKCAEDIYNSIMTKKIFKKKKRKSK